jgi:hypothetical protein
MFSSVPFYHQSIRKTVIAFGSLFNDIYVNMEDEILRVPLAYAPKQKWYNRISDGKLEDGRTFSMTLPRMGFDIINYTYDPARKRNTIMQTMKIHDSEGVTGYDDVKKEQYYRYAEVPYNIEFGLYIMTKNMDTGLRIIEQILPYFTPEFTVTVNFTEIDKQIDIPITLSSIESEDLYEDGFEERRTIVWTLNFEAQTYFYGPIRDSKVVLYSATAFHDSLDETTERDEGTQKDLETLTAYAVEAGLASGVTGPAATGPDIYEARIEKELFKDIDSTWFE